MFIEQNNIELLIDYLQRYDIRLSTNIDYGDTLLLLKDDKTIMLLEKYFSEELLTRWNRIKEERKRNEEYRKLQELYEKNRKAQEQRNEYADAIYENQELFREERTKKFEFSNNLSEPYCIIS